MGKAVFSLFEFVNPLFTLLNENLLKIKLFKFCVRVCVCVCASVFQVRNGGSEFSPILGKRYCGNELPPSVTSTQNLLWLKFHTDGATDMQSIGFSAQYTSGSPG